MAKVSQLAGGVQKKRCLFSTPINYSARPLLRIQEMASSCLSLKKVWTEKNYSARKFEWNSGHVNSELGKKRENGLSNFSYEYTQKNFALNTKIGGIYERLLRISGIRKHQKNLKMP